MKERAQFCGGDVQISSSPGKGTTVTVRVPVDAPGAEGRAMHILIADDHAVVRRALKEILANAFPARASPKSETGMRYLAIWVNPKLPCWCWISTCRVVAGWTCCGM